MLTCNHFKIKSLKNTIDYFLKYNTKVLWVWFFQQSRMDVRVGPYRRLERWRIDAFELVVLEKTLEGPLDCKEIKPVSPKGNQPWIFIGSIDAEADTPALWPPDMKSWFIIKDPDAGKDWRQEEKGTTEDKMVGWHHQLNEHEFEQAPGNGEGQGSLACCSPWGH